MRSFYKKTRSVKSNIRQKFSALLAVILCLQIILPLVEPGWFQVQAATAPKYITFLYDDFNQAASRLKFNNAASVTSDGRLRLTPASPDKTGSVFNKERLSLTASNAFSTYFVFQTSGQGSTNPSAFEPGADGFVFTLQTDSNSAGGLGNGIGFGGANGTQGIKNSLGIEFDTYPNTEAAIGDPSNNHIGIHLDGTVKHKNADGSAKVVKDIPKSQFNFKDPTKQFHVWIDYNGDKIQVFLNDNVSKPSTAIVEQAHVNLSAILKSSDVYAGFTSATGGAYENHDILKWYLTNKYDPIDPSCGCYKEAPSLFTVRSSVYETVYKPSQSVFYSDIDLRNSKGEKGEGLQLELSRLTNVRFLNENNQFQPYGANPAFTTDVDGKVRYYYESLNPSSPTKPSFRLSTEFGAYQDVVLSGPPTVDTGTVTPQYNANNPSMGAVVNVDLLKTGGEPVTDWGVQYRLKTEDSSQAGSWTSVRGEPYVLDSEGTRPVSLTGLQESRPYEARAYAKNINDIQYGQPVTFIIEMPMDRNDVQYEHVTPSHLYVDDPQKVRLTGQAFNKLLKKYPASDLSMKLSGNGQSYSVPAANLKLISETVLEIALPKQADGRNLPLGVYDLEISHTFFNSKTFKDAVTITNDALYRSINYDEVVVENRSDFQDENSVKKIKLRGPFVERGDKPNVFELSNNDAVVTMNDNLFFKGSSLTVDKTDPNHEKIKGNGRLYVNGKGMVPVMTTYTIREGSFDFEANQFEFRFSDLNSPFDYIGMNMPVVIESFTFIEGGIRVKGKMNVEFKAGSAKVKGEAKIDALEFKKNRVDLDADFTLGVDFKTGPVESSELRVGIDTRVPEYGFGTSAQLKNYNLGFEMDLLIKQSKLDTIKFAVNRKIKIGSTGAQFTRFGGGISNMASRDEAPLTLHLLSGLSDYVTPEIKGENAINGKELNAELSANHFGASGKLAIYTINVADLDLLVVARPAGYEGFTQPGFRMKSKVNVLDVLLGEALVKYFKGSSFTGYANARVQVPKSVKLIGGQALSQANIGVDDKRMNAGLSVIGIGFRVMYPFQTKKVDFDVDALQTVKNVAGAVVKTGKAVYNGVKKVTSWLFGSTAPISPKRVMILSADGPSKQPEVIGEKMFESSGAKVSGRGALIPGSVTTLVMETNPDIVATSIGEQLTVRHTLKIDESYKGFIVLNNANKNVRLVNPNGQAYDLHFTSATDPSGNAWYDEASSTVIIEVDFAQAGTWMLESSDTMNVTLHKALYRNPAAGFSAIADKLLTGDSESFIKMPVKERGSVLMEVRNAKPATTIIKPDGRPLVLNTDESLADWNSYRSTDGNTLFVMTDLSEVGTWLMDAGPDAVLDLYKIQSGVSMGKLKAWRQAPEFASMADFNGINGRQVLLEVGSASATTKLYRPDGSLYPLNLDRNAPGWNAKYDESRRVLTALVDVDTSGWWMVRSDDFTLLSILVFDKKATMEELNEEGVSYTYSLEMNETGKYLFDIAGGNETTQITDPEGHVITIISYVASPNRNAILDKAGNSLKVTVDVNKTGQWKISSIGPISIDQYKVPPVPAFGSVQAASAQSGMNRFDLAWKVNDPKPGTKVRVMLTENPEEPVGQIVADHLPASGVKTITLPDGNLPGKYWLSFVADSEAFGPIFKVLEQPIDVTASQTLPTPGDLKVTSTGNGEISLSFKDANWANVSQYRVLTADEQGKIKYNGPSLDVTPAAQEAQTAIVSGLEPGRTHYLAVIAIRQAEAGGFISPPTALVPVHLPAPVPAKLNVQLDTNGAAAVDHLYMPYYVLPEDLQGLTASQQNDLKEKLTVSAANRVTFNVNSDQMSQVELFVNNQSLGVKKATPELGASFVLEPLAERDYTITVEAVNERGDKSSYYQKLIIDRTAPHLSLKGAYNGQVVTGNRAKLVGATEAGARLTVNDVVVPVDQMGRFEYFAPIPSSGTLAVYIVAQDELGNKTENRLEIVKKGEDSSEARADLAAFATDEGVLTTEFLTSNRNYQTAIDANVKQLRVSAVPVEPDAVVTINGQAVDVDHSALIDVTGITSILAKVHAADSTEKTYTLQVSTYSDVASLKKLNLNWDPAEVADASSQPQLSTAFNSTKQSYDVYVGNEVTKTSVTPTSFMNGSAMKVNGQETPSGQASSSIALNVGENKINVQVLSPTESKKPESAVNASGRRDWSKAVTYTVTVYREASTNASLQAMSISGVQLTPGTFNSEQFNYEAIVPSNLSSATLQLQASEPTAVVRVNGSIISGTTALNLTEGSNRFEIIVTAPSGDTQTYTLRVYRPKAAVTHLNLSQLSVVGKELNKTFSPIQLNYSIKEYFFSPVLTVKALAEEAGAKVTVDGHAVNEKGTATTMLAAGANTVLVRVESQDGTDSKIYAIAVNYSPVNNSSHAAVPEVDPMPTTSGSFSIHINDNANQTAAVSEVKKQDGQDVVRVSFVTEQLEKALDSEQAHPVISIAVPDKHDKLVIELVGSMIKKMEQKEAVLDIHTSQAAYRLPASVMNIDEIGSRFGSNVRLEDVKVQVQMTPSTVNFPALESTATALGVSLLVAPVDFRVSYMYEGRELESERFTKYVERALSLPDSVDPQTITTGVRVNADGSLYHVPTFVKQENGRYWAYMNSYTNSLYTVISNKRTFADVNGHWAQATVTDLASRLVVDGKSANRFEPDQKITRAEFIAIVMRSLGLAPQSGVVSYSDVSASDWFGPVVAEASLKGLISGYEDNTFRPNAPISRAEATAILNKAWVIAGMQAVNPADAETALAAVRDQSDIPVWAKQAFGSAVKLGLMQGYEDGSVQPDRHITRAESAALLRGLLVKSGLIQP